MTRDEALAFADLREHDVAEHSEINDHDVALILLANELRQLLIDAGTPNRALEARVIEQTRWIAKLDDENVYLQKQNEKLAQWVDNLHAELSDAIARLGGESYQVVNRTRDEILAELESQRVGRVPKPSLKDKYKSIGFAAGVIPFSWGFGPWVRPHKIAIALGPLRLFIYRSLKDWKSYDGAPRH